MNQTLLETRVSDKSADFVWSGPVRVVEFGTYSACLLAIKYWETQNIPFVCVLFIIGSTFPTGFSSSKHCSPVSERPRTTVSVGALRPGLQCRHAATSAFRQPSSTCRTAFPAQHLGRRAFSVASPMAWNSLADFIRDPMNSTDCFRRLLET